MMYTILHPGTWVYTLGLPGSFHFSLLLLTVFTVLLLFSFGEEDRKGMGIMLLIFFLLCVLPLRLYRESLISFGAAAHAYHQEIGLLIVLCMAGAGWGRERKNNSGAFPY